VTSLTTSAFNLPDRLIAKADPALIAADEQHFAAIADRLGQSVAELSGRLEAERQAPGGIGQQALERDLEIHRLSARLRVLRRFGLDLCLGHIVRAGDPDPVYVGRVGLTDQAGRRLLLDWRSPAAEPFFGATHANPMGLASRRRYRWAGGRVSVYWDEVFTPDGLDGHTALDDQSAFIASLGAGGPAGCGRSRHHPGRPGRDHPRGLRGALVDGGPGTATVVALHRTAYLLYSDPRLGHRRGACCSSARTSPTWPTSPTCCPAWARTGCRPAPCGTSSRRSHCGSEADQEVARLKSSADLVQAISKPCGSTRTRPPRR
jgi:hypothetical protein